MAQDLAALTKEIFPTAPDRLPLFAVDSQQQVLAGLQRDITEGLHLLCLTGPPGSGKTALLQALQQAATGFVALIAAPTPGRLLFDMAKALRLDVPDANESIVRRRLGMRLVSSEQRRSRPLLLIDSAENLLPEDLDLLFHFFPRGHASVVLASTHDPAAWLGPAEAAPPIVSRQGKRRGGVVAHKGAVGDGHRRVQQPERPAGAGAAVGGVGIVVHKGAVADV